jgi:hypothetical protein
MSEHFAHGYALLIGVDESQVPPWSLPDVAKDVRALKEVLLHPQRCAYAEGNVRVLTGPAATRQGILDGLEWQRRRLQADPDGNATAVVYYSGHGWQDGADPPNYFLIPYDVSVERLRSQALRAEDFAEQIEALRPSRLLVILDCCHAGGMGVKEPFDLPAGYVARAWPPARLMGREPVLASTANGAKGLEVLARGCGRAVLSSSSGEQRSYMRPDGRMSIFTYHLIEALTGHAMPQEGATEVLVSDVMGHVWRRVPESARAAWGAEQTPDYLVSGNFPVALLLGGKGLGRGETPPDPLERLDRERSGDVYRIDTGGGPYIGGGVTVQGGDFVGRDKPLVHITGDGNVVGDHSRATVYKPAGAGVTVEELLALLAEVRRLLPMAGLDTETAAVVEGDLRAVEEQARRERPRGAVILSRLKAVGEALKVAAAAGTLLSLVEKAVARAQQLFR